MAMKIACALLIATWLIVVLQAGVTARYVRPEDCTWEPMTDTSAVSMTCSVRTLQSGRNPTNFSLIMPGRTVQLTIVCDDLMFQSEMANSSFEHLRGLRSLAIERCKLDRLPSKAFEGLSDLKQLTVKTFNSEWGTQMSLSVAPSSFVPLTGIESLDLSENNVDSLPHALLCELSHLRFVNLSKNAFSDVLNMGFSFKSLCHPAIRELELAHNKFKVLSKQAFASLLYLEELRVDHNQIARAEPGALTGLGQLERLDMAHNALVTLPSKFLQPTPKLSELYLRNNSLGALPPELFYGLSQLTMLDLAHNQLSSLGWLGEPNGLADLTRLCVLDLSHNRLTRIDMSAFRSLVNLQTLQLQNNLIEFIADNTFAKLANLQTLVLSNNRLKSVGPHTLVGLSASVMTLQLDNNRLEAIHTDAFKNISMLQELNLAGNRLKSVPNVVSSLNMLRSLDLSENDIQQVANASYQGLSQLYALNLMGNKIGNISQGAFSDLASVRILNLAGNGIQRIEQATFDEVPALHYLRLDSNLIEDVNGLFSNLHDLIMLNISVNRVRWFDYALVPVGLQWLDIHDNQIEALGNYFDLEQSLKLRTIDASFNRLTSLDSSSLPNGIEIAVLKNNNIKLIRPFAFLGKQNLTRVDLSNNNLQRLETSTFRLSEVPARRPLPEFAIANNPYLCDCHMQWLQDLQQPDQHRYFPRVVDLHKVECTIKLAKHSERVPLLQVKSSEFLCEYRSHCFSLCHCCDFDTCDCEMVCPDECSCYHDESWSANIVDCSGRHHNDIPKKLPFDSSEVYLDGNDIPVIVSQAFAGRKGIRVIRLNSSNVATIQNNSFAGLQDLVELHLENNRLSALHGHEFEGLARLRRLYVSNNRLKYVSNVTFVHLKSLEVLHLDRNYLTEVAASSLQYNNPRLNEVQLAGNPWTCDCYFVQELHQFLHERGFVVRDSYDLACLYNETTALVLTTLNATDCLNPSEATSLVRQFRRIDEIVPLLVTVGTLFVLVFVAMLAFVIYRHQMSVWFFSRYGVRMFHRAPAEEEKLFDAFVSYSKSDEAFVAQILAPELECGKPPYRLCLHYRDLPMAGGYLSEAIQEAVESSRRTIVVLSEHFLQSEWCRYEFKSAHHEVLNNGSSHKLIVIFLGRVSYRELDPEIRLWLKHSTFLHWGEKSFWDKLRYSMPSDAPRHRSKLMRSDLTSDKPWQGHPPSQQSVPQSLSTPDSRNVTSTTNWMSIAAPSHARSSGKLSRSENCVISPFTQHNDLVQPGYACDDFDNDLSYPTEAVYESLSEIGHHNFNDGDV
ncbi:slit3 protein-like [Tropilaelaps mercedesae]|uniref:Slit3 protein-like n=1 Tax=Tropilaelaps mercedesae TaxID=418985 RepID=A0A1V9XYR7_9ACAR|nr:slit3 protein-like [Tropilaelaps mercedesae]